MAKLLKLRRGTDTQHNSFTGAEGEVTVNTTNDSLHVHDGATAGGTELAKADLSNVDGSLSNNLGFADGTKALFGTGNDLEIEHTGSGSFIRTSTTATGDLAIEARNGGDLYLTGADDVLIRSQGGEAGLKVVGDGAVEAYYDNSLKLATTSGGINVTGSVTCDGMQCDGNVTIEAGDPALILKDSDNTGAGTSGQIQARTSADEVKWRLGDFSQANEHLNVWNNATSDIVLSTNNGGKQINFTSAGHWVPADNNAQDLGTSSTQWRNGYFDGTVNCDGINIAGNGALTGGDLTIGSSTDTSVYTRLDFEDSGGVGFINLNAYGTADFKFMHNRSGSAINGIPNSSAGLATAYGIPIYFTNNNTARAYFDTSGHFRPAANNTYDLGSGTERWRNVYTNDLNLSNEGGTNDVDGTWGSWTIQEGEDDLFLLNRRNGKKYKFNLSEVN